MAVQWLRDTGGEMERERELECIDGWWMDEEVGLLKAEIFRFRLGRYTRT